MKIVLSSYFLDVDTKTTSSAYCKHLYDINKIKINSAKICLRIFYTIVLFVIPLTYLMDNIIGWIIYIIQYAEYIRYEYTHHIFCESIY